MIMSLKEANCCFQNEEEKSPTFQGDRINSNFPSKLKCEHGENYPKSHQPTEFNADINSFPSYCIKRETEDSQCSFRSQAQNVSKEEIDIEEHKPSCELIGGTSNSGTSLIDGLDQCSSVQKNELLSLESKSEGLAKYNCARYKCEECSYKTINRGNLTQHYKYKHAKEVEVYKCQECSYETKYKSALIRHFKCIHAKEDKVYKCQECSYETRYNSDLTKHYKCIHAKEAEVYKCHECSFETKLRSNLTNHYKYKHTTEAKVYKCQECSYETRYKSAVTRHFKCIHAKEVKV